MIHLRLRVCALLMGLLTESRFGMAAFLFEMIPFASLAFSFTNSVGAALWAADMEKAMQ